MVVKLMTILSSSPDKIYSETVLVSISSEKKLEPTPDSGQLSRTEQEGEQVGLFR